MTWSIVARSKSGAFGVAVDNAPWTAVSPGVSTFLLILPFSLLVDGLRDALDPRRD